MLLENVCLAHFEFVQSITLHFIAWDAAMKAVIVNKNLFLTDLPSLKKNIKSHTTEHFSSMNHEVTV